MDKVQKSSNPEYIVGTIVLSCIEKNMSQFEEIDEIKTKTIKQGYIFKTRPSNDCLIQIPLGDRRYHQEL
jgi:hypothetical protein